MRVRDAALVLSLLILLASGARVWAHASLVKAEPADGAVLKEAPATLQLTFNEPVSPLVMRLISPAGEPIALGDVTTENATVTIAALPDLRRGTHALSWRVISADGHPVAGSLVFSIGAPSTPPSADGPGDRSVSAALWAAKVIIYVGLFIGIGGAFFRAWIADWASPAAVPWLLAMLAAGLLATPISVGLQGLDALGLPLSGLQQKIAWQAGLETAYGFTAITAAFALFAGLLSLSATSPTLARALSLVALLGLGFALALSGHAATAAPRLLMAPSVLVHGVCVAVWVGALLPLILALRHPHAGGGALAWFSRVIPYPLALLVITGLLLAVVQLGRLDALWTTSYGAVLACKLAAVAALFALAVANRYRLVPRFETTGGPTARPLAISIAGELALVLVILALVALWRFTPPPRALATNAPVSIHLHGEKAMAQIELAPDAAGGARASVLVLDGEFRPLTAKEVALALSNASAGIEPLRRAAVNQADGSWRIEDVRIPVAGRWLVRVEILVSDFEKVTLEDTVTLPRLP
jgi:copper transport protein